MSTTSGVDVDEETFEEIEESVGFDESVAVGGTGDGDGDGGVDGMFQHRFDLAVGQVVVEDKETREQKVMWKAKARESADADSRGADSLRRVRDASGESCVSTSVTDAVMGCIEQITGGEL